MACGYLVGGRKKEKGGGGCLKLVQALKSQDRRLQPPKDGLRICKFISMKITAKINKFNRSQLYF